MSVAEGIAVYRLNMGLTSVSDPFRAFFKRCHLASEADISLVFWPDLSPISSIELC